MAVEKSGVHITGADSGWPVGDGAHEPVYTKDGTGAAIVGHNATGVAAHTVTTQSSVNEVQVITPANVTGGSYKLTLTDPETGNSEQTAAITAGASLPTAAAVQSALEGLSFVEAGDVSVTGTAGGAMTVTFKGTLGAQDIAQMTVQDSTTGSGHAVTPSTTTPGAA